MFYNKAASSAALFILNTEKYFCLIIFQFFFSHLNSSRIKNFSSVDGFIISKVDLELRGAGEYFGTRQSGLPGFLLANIISDADLLTVARKEAFDIVERDPHLTRTEHKNIRKEFEFVFKDLLSLVRVG